MADSDLPGLSSLAGADLADADLLHVVDASDTTFAADGTDKKIAVSDLVAGLSARGLATDAEVTSAVSTHSAAADPHGDRAYAAALVDDLSGVSDAATARTNLGLGTAATQASTAFEAAGTVATHSADTTSVHGIADTSALLDTGDLGVSVQGYDGDLAGIAALTPSNDDFMQRKSGAWTNRTVAQVKTDLNVKPPTQQIFSSGSGTYTTPAGCTAILVQAVGGGGGGAACAGSATQAAAGQGGQAGGYTQKLITSPSATYSYAVGAGGAGGTAGANNGTSGGDSTFGTALLSAGGGEFGYFMSVGTSVTVRFGQATLGIASGGDINVNGQPGQAGQRYSATVVMGGHGGPGPWGGGGAGINGNSPGSPGVGPGAGGGGAGVASVNTARAGGDGAAGVIIVTEFYG